MLKQTITFEDYNGEESTETLYFNLTKTELMDLQYLVPRLAAWKESTAGEPRELTREEIQEMLDIVKILIEKSYGVRSDDGKRFVKSPALFEAFQQMAVYDSFVFGLFENPQKAVDFMTGIMPKDLVEQVTLSSENGKNNVVVDQKARSVLGVADLPPEPVQEKRFNDFSRQQLLEMSDEEFAKLVPEKANDMSRDQLVVAMERKSRASRE